MAFESNLEYQDEDGALILKKEAFGNRLMGFYNTLQAACEEFGPDQDLGIDCHIRAWSLTGTPRRY